VAAESRIPRVFLASSTEAQRIMTAIALLVERAGGVPLQWPDAFPVGNFILEALLDASRNVDAAIIIASPDDRGVVRRKSSFMPRDNVLVELGIFLGTLGRKKVALVYAERAHGKLRLPGDLNGLTYMSYNESTPVENQARITEWIRGLGASRQVAETLPSPEDARYRWGHVELGIQLLLKKMSDDHYLPDAVIGLGRSGAVIGGLIASHLGSIPLRVVDLKYSEGTSELIVNFQQEGIAIPAEAKKLLVVEGATTGGVTPREAKKLLERLFPNVEIRFAFLILSETSQFRGDYFAYVQGSRIKSLPWHGPKSKRYLAFADAE
jgi:hypoxanthine phosphoribosyltransferase